MATSNIRIKKVCEWCENEFESQNAPHVSVANDVRNMPIKTARDRNENKRRKRW